MLIEVVETLSVATQGLERLFANALFSIPAIPLPTSTGLPILPL